MERFYEIQPAANVTTPLLFDTPRGRLDVTPDPWAYSASERLDRSELWVPVYSPGARYDVHMTTYGIWLVLPEVGEFIAHYVPPTQLQRIPCVTETDEMLEILNTLTLIDCLDESRCEGIQRFTPRQRPDRSGQIKWIKRWMIDPSKVLGHHLFRIKGYSLSLVASETLKKALEARKTTGISFHPVSP